MINAKLIVVGGAKEAEVELKQLPTTIGRAREATITLPHNLVSRRHCEIFEQDGCLYVKDLNSLNGTYLNNEKIAGTQQLLPNQLLTLGNVTFRAVYETDADMEMPTAPPNSQLDRDTSSTDDWQQGETIAADLLAYCNSSSDDLEPNRAVPIDEPDTDHAAGMVPRPFADPHFDTEAERFVVGDEEPSRNKSISLGAIENLPQQHPGASFAGAIQVDSGHLPVKLDDDTVQIDSGEDHPRQREAGESGLESFLRKLPK